jgi:hypothetical protein
MYICGKGTHSDTTFNAIKLPGRRPASRHGILDGNKRGRTLQTLYYGIEYSSYDGCSRASVSTLTSLTSCPSASSFAIIEVTLAAIFHLPITAAEAAVMYQVTMRNMFGVEAQKAAHGWLILTRRLIKVAHRAVTLHVVAHCLKAFAEVVQSRK